MVRPPAAAPVAPRGRATHSAPRDAIRAPSRASPRVHAHASLPRDDPPPAAHAMCKRLFSCSPFQLRLLPCRLSPLPFLLLCPGRQSIPSAPSCAPSHTSALPPPSCLQRLWRRLSSCPPLQLHLLSCRPSPLPSLLLYLDRQPNPSISLSTPSHTSTQPPPSRLRRLMWKRLCCWEPFQLGLPSHRPSPLPSLLPCRDRQPIPPAISRLPLSPPPLPPFAALPAPSSTHRSHLTHFPLTCTPACPYTSPHGTVQGWMVLHFNLLSSLCMCMS